MRQRSPRRVPCDGHAFGRARLWRLSARARSSPTTTWPRWSTPPTSGSAAHRHPRAPHRRRRRDDLRPRRRTRPAAALADAGVVDRRRSTSSCWRPRRRPHLSGDRRDRAGEARHAPVAPPSTCRRSAPASSSRWPRPTASCAPGQARRALVIGAETFSRILDWTDRTTCVLFGDGAGAVVLEARSSRDAAPTAACSPPTCAPTAATRTSSTSTAGRRRPAPSATCAWRAARCFRHAVGNDHRRDRGRLRGDRLIAPADIDWFVPHQANSASSTARPTSSASPPRRSSRRSTATATPRPPRSRWRWRWPSATAASSAATWCCSKPWAAASPGARRCCAGEQLPIAPSTVACTGSDG